jgi:hypothetical protein
VTLIIAVHMPSVAVLMAGSALPAGAGQGTGRLGGLSLFGFTDESWPHPTTSFGPTS